MQREAKMRLLIKTWISDLRTGFIAFEYRARYCKYLEKRNRNHTFREKKVGDLLVDLGHLINGIFLIGLVTWSENANFEFLFERSKIASKMKKSLCHQFSCVFEFFLFLSLTQFLWPSLQIIFSKFTWFLALNECSYSLSDLIFTTVSYALRHDNLILTYEKYKIKFVNKI